jgi:hypothetical protein
MLTTKDKIFYDEYVQANSKLFWAFIRSKKNCKLSNEELAVKFGVTTMSIVNWIKSLEHENYLTVTIVNKERTLIANG